MNDRALFGTDGVRAIAGRYPLDPPTLKQIGMAVGELYAQPGDNVLMANDTRESSTAIVNAICDGLLEMGVNVKRIGIIPTPGLAYLTAKTKAAAAVMVTASHNPAEYNGIKIFGRGGRKLTDEQEASLNRTIIGWIEPRFAGKAEDDPKLIEQYKDFLKSQAGKLDNLHVAIDAANGAASFIAAGLFEGLGAKVTALFNQPDGKNINQSCGATDTAALKAAVLKENLDVGIALDGDGDRVAMIDNQGRELNGDHILYILAVAYGYKELAATVMSNYGFEKALGQKGIKLHRTSVGDRYILDELEAGKLKLGGEQSGHIIFYDMIPSGDGLLAAIKTLKAVKDSGKSLAEWYDELKLMPQTLVNLKRKAEINSSDLEDFSKTETQAMNGQGRVMVRASGTEPLIRLMIEGPQADATAEVVAGRLKQKFGSSIE